MIRFIDMSPLANRAVTEDYIEGLRVCISPWLVESVTVWFKNIQDFLIMTVLFDLKKVDGEIQSSQHENFGPLDVQTKPVHMSQAVHFHGKSGHAR